MAEQNQISDKKILIVDDNESLRAIFTAAFKSDGFEVVSTKDGEEAWEKLKEGYTPNVILTGIIMPRMDGFGLFLKIHAEPRLKNIPVAMISHRGLLEDQKKAQVLGISDFILQNTTPPPEIVRRCKLLLGEMQKFKIACITNKFDGNLLAHFLQRRDSGSASLPSETEVTLELEAETTSGLFKIKVIQ